MKLALGVSLMGATALVVLYGIIMGIMVSGWRNSANQLWDLTAVQTRDTMMEVVNATLDFVQFAARTVPQTDAWVDGPQNTPHDPTNLLRSFAAFNEHSGYRLSSFGFLKRANSSHPPTAKVSWQIASGFGCPGYMYAFSDNEINPAFYGYCGKSDGTVDFTTRAYTGTDWGFKPQEQALLAAGTFTETFLPIFDLLGAFTVTYELTYKGATVLFAELDLNRLSNHISTQIDLLNGKALAYIYESATGALVAVNTPNTTALFNPVNGTRYTIQTLASEMNSGNWLITRTLHVRPGLNWTVAVAVESQEIYGNMNQSIIVASCASLGVLIALVLILWISIHCCVKRQLDAKKMGDPSIPYSVFDEVR